MALEHRVVAVIAANRGLGKAVGEGRAQLGATVVLGYRDGERGEAAHAAISGTTGNPQGEALRIDLTV